MKLYFCFIYCSFPVFEKDRAVYNLLSPHKLAFATRATPSFQISLNWSLALLFQFARTNQRKRGYLPYEISVRDKLVRDDDTV